MRITFEFATKDDCLDKMVPSDLRVLVAERDEAESLKDHDSRSLRACNRRLINLRSEYHNKMAEMEAEIEELESFLKIDKIPEPVFPPYQPEGEGMPRFGLHWNGPTKPLSVPMDSGYWTPWHLASTENKRLQARVAEIEEVVTTHLTQAGAEAFIKRKQHDYPKLYTYVESAYWSPQLRELQDWIIGLTPKQEKGQ